MNEFRSSACLSASHPCLAGHFPGNPIVPGVILLELVAVALREWRGPAIWIGRFTHVKFVGLLRPDEAFDIALLEETGGIRFRCTRGERLLCHGSLEPGTE